MILFFIDDIKATSTGKELSSFPKTEANTTMSLILWADATVWRPQIYISFPFTKENVSSTLSTHFLFLVQFQNGLREIEASAHVRAFTWSELTVSHSLCPRACFPKSRNFSGLFRMPQFTLYLRNAEVLSHQPLQSSFFFLHQKHVKRPAFENKRIAVHNRYFGPEKFSGFSGKSPQAPVAQNSRNFSGAFSMT